VTAQERSTSHVVMNLRLAKEGIRAIAVPWSAKKILCPRQTLNRSSRCGPPSEVTVKQRRQEQFRRISEPGCRTRQRGDARAAAQLRGWRYADQRNQRRLERDPEANALHIAATAEDNEEIRLGRLCAATAFRLNGTKSCHQIAATESGRSTARPRRVVHADRRVSVIDRGRLVTYSAGRRNCFGLEWPPAMDRECPVRHRRVEADVRDRVQHGMFVNHEPGDAKRSRA